MNPDYRRTTITVPIQLKERMKRARALVNWSAVACDAFEKKLDELGPVEEITSIDGAIARMKSMRDEMKSEKVASPDGKESGKHWAMNFATPTQLKSIEGLRTGRSSQEWIEFMTSRDGFEELTHCLETDRRVGPGHRPPKRRRSARESPSKRRPPGIEMDDHRKGRHREVWKSILDRRPDSPEFFLGFAEGALEIWRQIKDQL